MIGGGRRVVIGGGVSFLRRSSAEMRSLKLTLFVFGLGDTMGDGVWLDSVFGRSSCLVLSCRRRWNSGRPDVDVSSCTSGTEEGLIILDGE